MSVELKIENMGHVPSFKNKKMIARGRIITNPKKQKWMKTAITSFVSQLNYGSAITGNATSTGQHQRCSIVWLPQDDSWQWIPEINVKAVKVKKGNEGAKITVERIQ